MRKHTFGNSLIIIASVVFLFALYMVFFYAPTEISMGDVQRIFYFHVASAWVGFFGFFITAVGGVLYLLCRAPKWDILALSSAEIGLVFISMTLVTGMLWAKPVWGVFWTWEPRLTISAVQWLVYIAYGVLRRSVEGRERAARFSAVYGILAFITVPLSWFAIRWWRTLHPQVLSGNGMAIDPRMMTTLLISLGAFTLLYIAILYLRVQVELRHRDLMRLREEDRLTV